MANSPTLGLTMMAASQAQKEVVFNEFLIAMDALFRGVVLSAALSTPPGTPNVGDCYIVASGGTDAWSGKDHNVTFFYNGWQFVPPKDQMRLYDQNATVWKVYHASTSSWDAEPASTVSVLNDLTNVQGSPTDGQVLTYVLSDGKWEPKNITFPSLHLSALGDVNVTEGSEINGQALAWNNADSKWEPKAFLSTAPGFLTLPDVTRPGGVGDGWVLSYTETGPGVTLVDPASLIAVHSLNQVGDVSYPVGGFSAIPSGAYLQWNGAAWVPSTSAVTISVESLSDGPGAFTGKTHQIVRVNLAETALEYHALALTELADVNITTGAGVDGYVVYWNQTAGKFALKAAGGGATALSSLSDVNVTEGAGIDGYVLKWSNASGKWFASALPGGGGSSSLSGDSDVSLTSPSDGQVLTYHAATSKWINADPTGAGGGSSTLAGDSDVAIATPANAQQLTYDAGSSKWKNTDARYDLALTIGGLMTSNEVVLQYVAPVAFRIPSGASGCYAIANAAATSTASLTLKKNGTTVGTITFAGARTSGSFSIGSNIDLSPGDVLQLIAPGSPDATLADLGVTLAGHRI